MGTGVINVGLPGKPRSVEVDPPHCHWHIERHHFSTPDFYHYDDRNKTWEIVRVIDKRKYA